MKTIIKKRNISNALIELLPGSRSNLLHYVCAQKNFKVIDLIKILKTFVIYLFGLDG